MMILITLFPEIVGRKGWSMSQGVESGKQGKGELWPIAIRRGPYLKELVHYVSSYPRWAES